MKINKLPVILGLAVCLVGYVPRPVLAESPPQEIAIAKLSSEPVIDGRLDEALWQGATLLSPFQRHGTTVGPTQQTWMRVGWTPNALYVAYRCQEAKVGQLRGNAFKRDDGQWLDDSVELFLDIEGKRQSSYHFIVSAANSQYDGRVRKVGAVEEVDALWDQRWESAVHKEANHWSVEIKIPYAVLGVNSPTANTRWAINGARHRTPVSDELSSWSFCNNRFSDLSSLVVARFAPSSVEAAFAGIPAPTPISVTTSKEPTLIAPISKTINPRELGGVAVRPAAQKGEVALLLSRPTGLVQMKTWPVRCGVPFPRGVLSNAGNVRLVDSMGQPVAVQTKVLGTWDEGKSVRWLLVNFTASLEQKYRLQFGSAVRAATPKPATPVTVSQDKDSFEVTTGSLRLQVSKHRHTVIEQIWYQGQSLLRSNGRHGAWQVDQDGHVFEAAKDSTEYSVEVEQAGPLRAVIKARSWLDDGQGNRLNQSISRIHVMAGSPVIQVQHTFVLTEGTKRHQYKNISFSLPLSEDAYKVKRSVAQPVAYDSFRDNWQKPLAITNATFSVSQLGNRKAQVLDGDKPAFQQNECAGGWVDVAGSKVGLGLAARWFSQNYPNELELTSTGDLTYHFWSPRFSHLMDLRPKPWLTSRGSYDVWQPVMVNEIGKGAKRWFEIPIEDGGTMDADGAGVAKTHDFALIVHDGADGAGSATGITEQAGAYLDEVYAYADPKWMVESEVFQRSLPAGDSRFKNEDAVLAGLMARMMADQRNDRLYDARYGASLGIFDFGDDLTQNKHPHRFFAHFFYCSPTTPWHLYFRSGTRTARELAEANSRHRMDVDMCHFTHDVGSASRAGAWNQDDCGILHWGWYGATHVSTSNYGPHLAYMYYLTGDERAYDVALEATDALKWAAKKEGLQAFAHRGTGMTLWNIMELWQLTGDPALKKYADHYANVHVKAVREGLAFGYESDAPTDFTMSYVMPAMIRYHMATGTKDVAQWIVNQAAQLAREQRPASQGAFAFWDGLAYAYQLTGDPRYLQPAALDLQNYNAAFQRDGIEQHLAMNYFIGYRAWRAYQAPMLMGMLKKAGYPGPPPVRGDDLATAHEIVVLNEKATPLQIDVAVQAGREDWALIEQAVRAGDLAILLKNPKGVVVARAEYPAGNLDKWVFNGPWVARLVDKKSPMTGTYRVEVGSKVPGVRLLLKPVASTSGKVMSRLAADGAGSAGRRYFAFVPAGARRFGFRIALTKQLIFGDPVNIGRIFTPDGKEIARIDYRARSREWDGQPAGDGAQQWLELAVDVPAGLDGKVWQIEPPPYVPGRKIELVGSTPYLAATAHSCFDVAPMP